MAKLILTQEVTGLGSAGDVVEVKDGYARNYLLPRDYATNWTKGGEKQVELIQAARRARAIANKEDAEAQATQLKSATVDLKVTAGDSGRLFGAVKATDIAEAVAAAGLGEIDRRSITIPEPIKAVGKYKANVRLHEDVVGSIDLNVVAASKKKKK